MFKDKVKQCILYILIVVIVPIQVVLAMDILGTDFISPIIVKNLAKNPKNIKDNGCLRYVGKWNNSIDMYSLNNQVSKRLESITIKEFPFHKKWRTQSSDIRLNFNVIQSSKCVKVKYIEHKFIWRNNDFIYDIQS